MHKTISKHWWIFKIYVFSVIFNKNIQHMYMNCFKHTGDFPVSFLWYRSYNIQYNIVSKILLKMFSIWFFWLQTLLQLASFLFFIRRYMIICFWIFCVYGKRLLCTIFSIQFWTMRMKKIKCLVMIGIVMLICIWMWSEHFYWK